MPQPKLPGQFPNPDRTPMKNIRVLLTILASGLLPLGAFAAPGGDHAHDKQPEWAALFGGASLPAVWQSLGAASDRIATSLAAGKLDGVADMAETIHLGAHALVDQVKLDDKETKKRLDAALAQAARIADDILNAAQHGDVAATASAHRRAQAALALAQARLPKEIVDAPPQSPRFGTAPKHGDHAH